MITINTQEEFNAINEDVTGEIRIVGILERVNKSFKNAYINVSDNAQISYVSDNAQISYVYDNAQISYVYGNAQIRNVYGNASILFVDGNAKVSCKGKNIVSYYKDKTVDLDLSKQTTIVVLDRFKATIESYLETYPIEVKDGIATMYKAVRKLEDGKFVSDYDRSFEYKIGKKQKEKCSDNKKESCAAGIHVSHKMWALRFGSGWDNMALLEFEVDLDKVIVAEDCDGKIRTSEVKCIREVPESEYYL